MGWIDYMIIFTFSINIPQNWKNKVEISKRHFTRVFLQKTYKHFCRIQQRPRCFPRDEILRRKFHLGVQLATWLELPCLKSEQVPENWVENLQNWFLNLVKIYEKLNLRIGPELFPFLWLVPIHFEAFLRRLKPSNLQNLKVFSIPAFWNLFFRVSNVCFVNKSCRGCVNFGTSMLPVSSQIITKKAKKRHFQNNKIHQ